jgi:quinol monooxygenase YgiN
MPDEKLTVVAYIKAKPGQAEAVQEALMALIEPTRNEPACINYDLHRSNTDPDLFMFYENWRSKEDLDAHLETPHLTAFKAKAGELLAEPLKVELFTMNSEPAKP